MKRNLIRLSALLIVTVLIALCLGSCTMRADSIEAREICEKYIDAVLANDFDTAYDIFDDIAKHSEIATIWNYTRVVLDDSKSYELKQIGWNFETDDGVTLRQVTFELVSDDNKTVYISVVLGDDGIYGFNIVDSTAFIKKTTFVRVIGVIMTLISIALFGVTIWMIVDACKRKIKN